MSWTWRGKGYLCHSYLAHAKDRSNNTNAFAKAIVDFTNSSKGLSDKELRNGMVDLILQYEPEIGDEIPLYNYIKKHASDSSAKQSDVMEILMRAQKENQASSDKITEMMKKDQLKFNGMFHPSNLKYKNQAEAAKRRGRRWL